MIDAYLKDSFTKYVVVDPENDAIFSIRAVVEVSDGGHGLDTLVIMAAAKGGEIRQELLSILRDPDSYRLFDSLASAQAYVAGASKEG